MPMYEFVCDRCQHAFEEMTSISDRDAKKTCPSCGSKKTRRKLSAVGVGKSATPAKTGSGCGGCKHAKSCGMD